MIADGDEDCDNAAHIRIDEDGRNIQLYQRNIHLEANTKYQLSFSAHSSTASDMAVILHDDDAPYTHYGLKINQVNLGKDTEHYSVEFTTSNFSGSVDNARLRFWFAPFADDGDEYWIDDVSLVKADSTLAAAGATSTVVVTSDGILIGLTEAEFDRSILGTIDDGNQVGADSQLFLPYVGN